MIFQLVPNNLINSISEVQAKGWDIMLPIWTAAVWGYQGRLFKAKNMENFEQLFATWTALKHANGSADLDNIFLDIEQNIPSL